MKMQNKRHLTHERSALSWMLGAMAMVAVTFGGAIAERPTQDTINNHDQVVGKGTAFVSSATQTSTVEAASTSVQMTQIDAEPRLRRSLRGSHYCDHYGARYYQQIRDFFSARYQCGTRMVGSGVIQSPNSQQLYSKRVFCSWALEAAQNHVGIFIQFKQRSTASCCYFLQIHDQVENRFTMLASDSPRNITFGPRATVDFYPMWSSNDVGFEITFSSIPPSEERTVQASSNFSTVARVMATRTNFNDGGSGDDEDR